MFDVPGAGPAEPGRARPGPAQQELERAIAQSEKLGLRGLLAKSHYVLANALRLAGNESDASRHVGEARKMVDEIQKEAGSDDVLKRADFRAITRP